MRHLAQPDLGVAGSNALILSEYVKDGHGLSRLCTYLRSAGAVAVDAAVLNFDCPSKYATRPADTPDIVYDGEPFYYEPAMFFGVLKTAVGQVSVPGVAEPQDRPDADLELRAYVSEAFDSLAQEYTAQELV